jgi:uncharacterized protein DUF6801
MKRRMSTSVFARIAGAGVVGAVVAVGALVGAGVASATPIDKTFAYDCNIPIFGHKTLNIEVKVDIPATGTVGTPIQAGPFTAITPIPHDVYDVFTPFGATQADGTAEASAVVDLPGNTPNPQTLNINATIAMTQVPNPSGPDMLLPATGTVPAATANVTGTASVSLGSSLTAHVTPRDSSGNPTILGTLDVPCTATGATPLSTVVVS